MKKFFKVLAVLAAIGVALLVIGSILLKIYMPPEKAKKLVLDRLSGQLKREVTLGSASVGILSGLQMTDLKISESPNFTKGVFLSSDQFSLKVALLPLIYRKVVVRQIILTKPVVTLVRNADGKTFNFSDLTTTVVPSPPAGEGGRRPDEGTPHPEAAAASPSPARGEGKSTAPFLLLVSRADVQKGAVHFIDHSPARQSADITAFDLTLKNVSLTAPFSLQTSMQVKSKGSTLVVDFAGTADLLEGSFKIKQGTLVSDKSKVTVTGKVSGLKSSAPSVDLNLDIPQLDLANFRGFVALPPELRTEGSFTGRADLSGDQKAMNFSATIDGANVNVQYAALFSKPAKAPLSVSAGGVVKNLAEADIQSLKMILGLMTVSGHGKIQNLQSAAPLLGLHVETNSFPIDDLLKYVKVTLPAGVSLKGTNKLSADLSGTAANAQFAAKWDGSDLAVSQGENFAKPAGLPLELSIIGATAGANKILIKTLTAKLLSNQVIGSGTYETKGTQSVIAFAAKGTNWAVQDLAKVSPLAAPFHPTGTLSFDLRADGPTSAPRTSVQTSADILMADIKHEYYEGKNLQMKWNLTDVTPDLAKVGGTASLKQGPGKVMNVEKLAATSKIGKIALQPLAVLAKLQKNGVFQQVNLPSLESVPFDSLLGDYALHAGVMTVKTFNLNGRDLSILNQGTIGLPEPQPLNLTVVMKLAAGSVGGTMGAIMNDENGRPTLKYLVTGTSAHPIVKLDTQELGKKGLEQGAKELMKNKNVQDAVDDIQKSLKGIFH